MRTVKNPQLQLGGTSIEKIKINLKSRDDIPPLLLGLQHIYTNTELSEKVFAILEKNIKSIKNKKIAIGISGGTDSSINTLLLSQRDDISLKLFSIGFNDESDEFDDARIIAKLGNCEYKEVVLEVIINTGVTDADFED